MTGDGNPAYVKTVFNTLVAVWAITVGPFFNAPPIEAAPKPNIVFILTDDQGYGDVGRHGHPLLKTPNIDRLHDEAVRFDNFYVSPSCSPTRAALMTGMHEFRNGVTHTIQPREHLWKDAAILPQLLKTAGYRTGFIGKWHLGGGKGYSPGERGFDWTATNPNGPRKHFDPDIIRNGRRTKRRGYREDLFFDEAMTFIREGGERRFFCYLATYSPHTPLAAPEKFIAPFRGKVTEEQATYLGMVANIDYNVGRLLKFLGEHGLEKDTILLFMNDNGQTKGLDVYNAGMRGCKCTIWEGGSRAMSLWRWPGHWTPHKVDNLTAHLDVLPTLCELAGVGLPKELQSELEGFTLVPLLEAKAPLSWHNDRMLFHHVARWPSGMAEAHKYAMCAVRQGNYLLLRSRPCDDPRCTPKVRGNQCHALRNVEKGTTKLIYTDDAQFHWGVSPADRWVLFDVREDPACKRDLARAKRELAARMAAAYDRWWDDVYPDMVARGADRAKSRAVSADGFAEQRTQVAALAKLTAPPAMQNAAGFESTQNLKAIYFDALPWRGKPTKVFAWLGMPETTIGKVPGIVLVHGGGGSAFKTWVEKWNARGFAAISIAVEGQTDVRESKRVWKQHDWPGPKRAGIYGDSGEPLKDQWMYHAVADTILANSLLRSLPGVDADKVGLMGISWGGVITSTVMGIDSRFAFAIPTYGCGRKATAANQYGRALGDNAVYQEVWDPMLRMSNATMPALWFSWPEDKHFPLDCHAASYQAAPGPRMVSLIPRMGHGHGPPWNKPDSYAFAEAVVKDGKPWCRQLSVSANGRVVRVELSSTKPLEKAVLVSTTDSGITGERNWVESAARIVKNGRRSVVTADLPGGTTAWFVNVMSGNLTVSSDFTEVGE